jgi:type IV secretory pathway TrbL component
MPKYFAALLICLSMIIVPVAQPLCLADGGATVGALGAAAAGAGAGGAAGISAATVAGVAAAAAAAVAAGALSGDDGGMNVLGVATTHSNPPIVDGEDTGVTTTHGQVTYSPPITPSPSTPSAHSTPTH